MTMRATDEFPLPPLDDAIELVKLAGRGGFRNYPGTGGIWFGDHSGLAQGRFDDWGLGRAVAEILNAVVQGRLRVVDGEAAIKSEERS